MTGRISQHELRSFLSWFGCSEKAELSGKRPCDHPGHER